MPNSTTARNRMNNNNTIIHVTILLIVLLSMMPTSKGHEMRIVLQNNHTNFLSVRCFSFNDEFIAQHLMPNQNYTFEFTTRIFFPSATMFNCSTNMGAFVAYRYDYQCSDAKYANCEWRFDENKTYQWLPQSQKWIGLDYNPNYESLTRGGVVKGYYSN